MNPSERIDKHIAELADWRGQLVARLRKLILEADPDITEEWKWNTAVWSHQGLVCSVGAFKQTVKMNLFHGCAGYLGYPFEESRDCAGKIPSPMAITKRSIHSPCTSRTDKPMFNA
jgi:hypothetical protein